MADEKPNGRLYTVRTDAGIFIVPTDNQNRLWGDSTRSLDALEGVGKYLHSVKQTTLIKKGTSVVTSVNTEKNLIYLPCYRWSELPTVIESQEGLSPEELAKIVSNNPPFKKN